MQVTVARYTYAYGTFLVLFTLIYMAIVSVLRSADMMAGLVLGILGAIIVVVGQFVWPAHLLWTGVSVPGMLQACMSVLKATECHIHTSQHALKLLGCRSAQTHTVTLKSGHCR